MDNPANFDPVKLLAYGWLGFGVILVGFAYWILRKEQDKPKVEQSARILYSLYAFMGFSIFLGFIGYKYEMNKPGDGAKARVVELEEKIVKLEAETKEYRDKLARYHQREQEYIKNFEAGRGAVKSLVIAFPLKDRLEAKLLEFIDQHFKPRIIDEGVSSDKH
ncbi:hypothetical protein GC170_05145 [bacterium]|nr:hypothetical protein [bacterium]